jgi:hypothetical protein
LGCFAVGADKAAIKIIYKVPEMLTEMGLRWQLRCCPQLLGLHWWFTLIFSALNVQGSSWTQLLFHNIAERGAPKSPASQRLGEPLGRRQESMKQRRDEHSRRTLNRYRHMSKKRNLAKRWRHQSKVVRLVSQAFAEMYPRRRSAKTWCTD